jgi:subtilisin family serine protease
VYGNPVYGNPVYGNPVYGNPVYGNPVYGNPVYGNPVYGNPSAGASGPPPPLPCCCDDDPCQCRTSPPAAPASFVYPNPAYVATVYPGGEGLPYKLTGQRRSQARPLLGIDAARLGEVGDWDTAPVRIAVLDTGRAAADAHLATPPGNVLGDDDKGPDSDGDHYLDPVAGHGTFIGGLIARVAPGCGLMIKRVLSDYGDGDEQAIGDAIEELIEPARCGHEAPHLLNLSFSGYVLEDDGATCLRNAIRKAARKGIIVVASAGNDGICRRAYPAAFTGVVGVGALGEEGPAPFSNWGAWVRACAPGVDVASTFYEYTSGRERMRYGLDPDLYEGFATWSGTSFAAPVVVGVLARTMMDRGLTANQAVEAIIDQTGLFHLRCYGTVVNTLAVRPLCP